MTTTAVRPAVRSAADKLGMTDEEMYAVCLSSDGTYNGRFWIGVLTTGIYCLPACHARKPYLRNVRFFADVQEARAAGLRPCKKCYPDDFANGLDPVIVQIEALADEVRCRPADFPDVRTLVQRSGYGTTRLFELFRLRFDTTPAEFLLKARIDAAKRLLEASDGTVSDAAYAAGFASLSAFHANFKRSTGMTPSAYRCQTRSTK